MICTLDFGLSEDRSSGLSSPLRPCRPGSHPPKISISFHLVDSGSSAESWRYDYLCTYSRVSDVTSVVAQCRPVNERSFRERILLAIAEASSRLAGVEEAGEPW